MKKCVPIISLVLCFFLSTAALAEPPFQTSFHIGSDIFRESDVSIAFDLVYEGVQERTAYDRRYQESRTDDFYIYTTNYDDGYSVEFQVNSEFGVELGEGEVAYYAKMVGQMPYVLRSKLDLITLYLGNEAWAAFSRSMLIHTEATYEQTNQAEEVMVHELVHVSLRSLYKESVEWAEAQTSDDAFISNYARDYPQDEDMPESFLAYVALRHKRDRIPDSTAAAIVETIPARIAFFDSLDFNMEPLRQFDFYINAGLSGGWFEQATAGQGFYIEVLPSNKLISLAWFTYDTERPPADATANLGEPGHRWITALGPYEGNVANLTVYQTSGGVFNSETPKPATDQNGDGTITLEFDGCSAGLVSYEITSLGLSGEIPIQRIAPDNVAICETGLLD